MFVYSYGEDAPHGIFTIDPLYLFCGASVLCVSCCGPQLLDVGASSSEACKSVPIGSFGQQQQPLGSAQEESSEAVDYDTDTEDIKNSRQAKKSNKKIVKEGIRIQNLSRSERCKEGPSNRVNNFLATS